MEKEIIIRLLFDFIIRSIQVLQEISSKSKDEILELIKQESSRTDDLLKKLR